MIKFDLTITRKKVLILIFVTITLMIIDSSTVKYFSYNKELPTPTYVGIFITFTILFVGIVLVLLQFSRIKRSDFGIRRGLSLRNSFLIITLTQLILIAILAMVIQATIVLKSYNILLLFTAVYVTHILALFFLMHLVITLFGWIGTKRNRILLLYGISFSLTIAAIITSLIYSTYILSYQPTNIKPTFIHNSVIGLARADLANIFGRTLDGISILSFLSVWIASAVLLSTYSRRIGRIKYWTIVSIPLIYFLFSFETYFLTIFKPLMTSPVEYGVINVLVFSATKQIGALLFSLSYFAASTLVANKEMQKYLWLTAIGMAILFGCMDFDSLLYAAYPPFGLVTVSFMPIGSYLVVTGLTLSATLLARDKALRKEFYNTAMSQLSLLKTIGVTEMEKQLMKSYKAMDQRIRSLEKPTRFEKDEVKEALHGLVDEMDREDAREILHDVLTEVYSKSRIKSKS